MESREFVRLVKHEAVDETVRIIMKKLHSPQLPGPAVVESNLNPIMAGAINQWSNEHATAEQRRAGWFGELGEQSQKMLREY